MPFPSPGVLVDIVTNYADVKRQEPFRFNLQPGDWACLEPNCVVRGDIVLKSHRSLETLEQEAFTGRSKTEVTGWIRTGDVALVIAVVDDEAFLWSREGNGYGWIDRQFVCSIHDLPGE